MKLTDIEAIANLARLDLTPEELDRFATQFEGILDLFRTLDGIDTSHAGATTTERHAPPRSDGTAPTLPLADVLANNPASDRDRFLVPKILDDGSS